MQPSHSSGSWRMSHQADPTRRTLASPASAGGDGPGRQGRSGSGGECPSGGAGEGGCEKTSQGGCESKSGGAGSGASGGGGSGASGGELDGQRRLAQAVLDTEAEAVRRIVLDDSFDRAVQLLLDAPGSVVVTGLGKSGLIGRKISATLASTGTPSHFLHPVEALHGDLGRVRRGDLVLALSYTGSTEEIVTLATILRQDRVPIVALVGPPACDLARLASVTLSIGDVTEACPHNLAPTASTTAMLALGDALALCVARRRDFSAQDFKRYHPGGGLGRQLMPVVQAMRFRIGVNLPLIRPEMSVQEAFATAEQAVTSASGGGDAGEDATARRPGTPSPALNGGATSPRPAGPRRAGAFLVVHPDGTLAGIFTDGDLRRTLIRHGSDAWARPIGDYMTRQPRTLGDTALVREAVQLMREYRFDEIPVIDPANRPLGLIDVQDLVALKVIEG